SEAVLQLRDLEVDVDYVQSNDGRRFGAIVVNSGNGQVRLIDNVPRHQFRNTLICGDDHPPPSVGENSYPRALGPVQE
ncbi:MAG: hypothetical protein VYC77_09020, partial [Pseudomonadota bacterium]|nr:hypothetical protein [Pseudomonadota bacterium]